MIYLLLADGFEETEAIVPLDIMRRAKLDVLTVGVYGKRVTGSHNITIEADITIKDVFLKDMQMLILPGGPGHELLDKSADVQALIDYASKRKIYIAAICASPSVLGKKGLLKDKKATCFPGYEAFLQGAHIVPDKVVFDTGVITACGAGAASDFGFKIVEVLKGKELAESVKKQMLY
ncbi:MAG: DJ-1/PfpI family protein [Clostridia bacterium]|nr:DJ-1/PfpI family protein [Clostridia bacterium]